MTQDPPSSPTYQVLQSARLADLLDHLTDEETLVVFDLDSTLMRPAQEVGSEHWEEYLIARWMDEGMVEREARKRAHDCWLTVQQKTRVRLIEPDAPDLIRKLQQRGHRVIGLTARATNLGFLTIEKLASLGIHLSHYDLADAHPHFHLSSCVGYTDGVLFAGYESKGKVLTHFFYLAASFPNKVIFVDDKKEHIYEVGLWMQERCVDYVGILYNAVNPDHLQPEAASLQWRYMHEILPDAAAAVLLAHGFKGSSEL